MVVTYWKPFSIRCVASFAVVAPAIMFSSSSIAMKCIHLCGGLEFSCRVLNYIGIHKIRLVCWTLLTS